MKTKIRDYLLSCLKCIEYSPMSGKREGSQGYLHSIPKGDRPFLSLHKDHFGPFEETENNSKFILVVIEGFTTLLYVVISVQINEDRRGN